jgi:hypothetical protein
MINSSTIINSSKSRSKSYTEEIFNPLTRTVDSIIKLDKITKKNLPTEWTLARQHLEEC